MLIVEDEDNLLRVYERALGGSGYVVETARNGADAAQLVEKGAFDAVVSDIAMPGMNGLQLLRTVREHDLDLPVVLITGKPSVETAVTALDYGALRYLVKPVETDVLEQVVADAVRLYRISKLKRQALADLGLQTRQIGDRAGLEGAFERALASLWMAYQPVLCWSQKQVLGYEALVRTAEATLPNPAALFDAGERLGRLHDLGRAIRKSIADVAAPAPEQGIIFVNLHARELLDEALFDPSAPLLPLASRVVFEITERAALDEVSDIRARVATLRKLGYRIALDDLGAGYAGLSSFAQLEPEVVKLDMSLVRDVDRAATKQKLIRSFADLCRDMGILVIAEGVETNEELRVLLALGCDLLQGYLFARPAQPFPAPQW